MKIKLPADIFQFRTASCIHIFSSKGYIIGYAIVIKIDRFCNDCILSSGTHLFPVSTFGTMENISLAVKARIREMHKGWALSINNESMEHSTVTT